MPGAVTDLLLALCILSGAVWLGGWVALVVVARSTTATLTREARVAFFRHFGRRYGIVATCALVVAYVTGGILLAGTQNTAVAGWLIVAACALVVVLGFGVLQARSMTRMRRAAMAAPDDDRLAARITHHARGATALRAGIGVLSLLILALAIIAAG